MTTPRHERLARIFLHASELPSAEREAYLDEACAGQPELRVRVEKMLRCERNAPRILEPGAVGLGAGLDDARTPERIGPYRIVGTLGEGGMGVVYEAEQERPVRRRVALKLIRPGLETRQVLARFETERQALALMSHPNIARVYDAGLTESGRPYFAMEFVDGPPVTTFCDEQRLGVRERLDLVVRVCEAVQHAHRKGVIHRDIKTSNVLIASIDGVPAPKIIDFGIAKATEQPSADLGVKTQHGQMFGTPAYMSPEQAGFGAQDVDTRADVYGLGALLYELLVGRPPFDSDPEVEPDEWMRRIREVDPAKPSAAALRDAPEEVAGKRATNPAALARRLRGDLDWIVMKALAKERERRYGSPSDLAADITRHLGNEPVLAGPPSKIYRLRKFVRRHKTGVSFAAVVLLLLVGFGFTITREARRADRAALLAEEEARRARQELRHAEGVSAFLIQLFEAAGSDAGGECASVCDLVDEAITDLERLDGQPLLQSRLLLMLGKIIHDEASVAEGRVALSRALAGLDGRKDTLDFLEEAAWKTAILRRLDEAELTFEHLAEVRARKLGEEDPETLLTTSELGRVYTLQGRLDEADARISSTLQTMRRVLGNDHEYTLKTIGYLASVLWRQRRIDDMGALLGAALDDMGRVLGERHHITLATCYNLARVEAAQGNRDRSLILLGRAVDGGFIYMGHDTEGRLVMGQNGMRSDPHLEALHGDAEFEAIVARAL